MTVEEMEKRQAEIAEEAKTATGDALAQLFDEAQKLNEGIKEARKQAEDAEKRKQIAQQIEKDEIKTSAVEKQEVRKMEHTSMDSMEYRKAFMDYVLTGEMAPEFRDISVTADNQAVIPPATMNQIVEKMEQYGNILPLVRKLAYPSGVVVPASTLAATGTWMADETAAIDAAKKATTKITFGAYELAAAIGVSFKADIQSLSAFEAAVAENVARAMTKALELAIVSGDGNGKPQGIATTAVKDAKRNVTLSSTLAYKDVISILKAIPGAYSAGTVLTMNESTFWDFMGITDASGKPVAVLNFNGSAPVAMIFGKKCVFTDYLPSLDDAKAGDVVAYAFNYDNYILNTAYEMDLVQYRDNPTRSKVYQSVGLYDGKVVDDNGLVLVKKAAASSTGK